MSQRLEGKKHIMRKQGPKVLMVMAVAMLLLLAAVPAMASSGHSASTTNNGCEWKGYHSYDEVDSGFAYGYTDELSGTCVEVNVKVRVNSANTWDYGTSFASVYISGWDLNFNYSDHNADPLGPDPYVGFRLY